MKWPFFKSAKTETKPAAPAPATPSKPRTVFTGVPLRPMTPSPLAGTRPLAARPPAPRQASAMAVPARVVSAPAAPAAPAPASTNGKTIPFALASVLSQLPAALVTAQNRSRFGQTTVQIPVRLVVPQLASGKISLTLGDLLPLLPKDLVPQPLTVDPSRHSVTLPLAEVVAAIPAEDLATTNGPAPDIDDPDLTQLPDLVNVDALPKKPFHEHPEPAAPASESEGSAEDLAALKKAGAPLHLTVRLSRLLASLPEDYLAASRAELLQKIDPNTAVSLPVAPMVSLLGAARPRLSLALVLKALPAAVLADPLPPCADQEVPLPLEEIVSQLPPSLFAIDNAEPEPIADELNGTQVGTPFLEKTPAPPVPAAPAPVAAAPAPVAPPAAPIRVASPVRASPAKDVPPAKHDTQRIQPWESNDRRAPPLTGRPRLGRPDIPAFADRPPDETQLLQPMPSDDEIPTPFSEKSPAPPLVESEAAVTPVPMPEPTPEPVAADASEPALPLPVPAEDQLPPEDLQLPDLFQERSEAVAASEPVAEPIADVPAEPLPEPVAEVPAVAETEPVAESVAEPVAAAAASAPAIEPVAELAPEPEPEPEPEPVLAEELPAVVEPEPVLEPAAPALAAAEPSAAAEPTVEPVVEPVAEPAAETVAETAPPAPVAEPVGEPEPVLAAMTVPETAARPAADVDGEDFDIDGEEPAPAGEIPVAAAAAAAIEPAPAASETPFDAEKFLARINVCSESDLMTVAGIGPALAKRIIDTRTAAGGFRSVDDVRRVPGLRAKTFQALCGVSFRALNHLLGVEYETELSLQEMVRLISGMRGVQGCMLTAADGLFLTGQLPAHLDQSRLSVFTPELFRKVGLYAQELAVGQVRRMTLFTELHPLSIFQAEEIYLIVIHDTRHFSKALLRRLTRISEELARYCRQRAAV